MKYICSKIENSGIEEIFVFPSSVDHDMFSEAIFGIRNSEESFSGYKFRVPVSAGFVTAGGICCGSRRQAAIRNDCHCAYSFIRISDHIFIRFQLN